MGLTRRPNGQVTVHAPRRVAGAPALPAMPSVDWVRSHEPPGSRTWATIVGEPGRAGSPAAANQSLVRPLVVDPERARRFAPARISDDILIIESYCHSDDF